ncbi:GDSL-type esterase/lipase family protein [Ruminococcaceae bacterium OttesenSCG-928-N02]|nr:GDSL-type esterase/lipase family protein [Ruminococcaceae bacterium OttesenSCG-928-N02]
MGIQTLPDGTTAVPMDLIQAAGSNKIYVLLGTNAMNYMTDEAFLTYYDQFMTELAVRMPHAQVYIQSITPTTAEIGAKPQYTLERIAALNDAIAGLAYNHGFHYVDINSVLSDETGYAREDLIYAGDGYHFRPEGYAVWREYLMTHVAHWTGTPYEYGSPAA